MKNNFEIFFSTQDCPVRNILSRFTDKWSILILAVLNQHEVLRFGELVKQVPDISQKMLTVSLRTLEADGLVCRKQYPEIPPRVEYKLSPLGESLLPHIKTLVEWAKDNTEQIVNSRKEFERSR